MIKLLSTEVQSELIQKPAVVDNFMSLLFPARRSARPYVLEHGHPQSVEIGYLGNRVMSHLGFAREVSAIRNAQGIICINTPMEARCKRLGARETIIIPNYPTRDFKPTCSRGDWMSQHGIPEESRLVIFSGNERLVEIYGIDLLLKSWRIVESKKHDTLLVLACPTHEWLMRLIRQMGLEHVLLTGFLSHKELANWVGASDVCLATRTPTFPSAYYNDMDSTKICEYAALSKPIVANNYLPSSQYLLVDSDATSLAQGIISALDGSVSPAQPRFWEDIENDLVRFVSRSLDLS